MGCSASAVSDSVLTNLVPQPHQHLVPRHAPAEDSQWFIGEGSTSQVWGVDNMGEKVAVKVIKLGKEDALGALTREKAILRTLEAFRARHPHIVELRAAVACIAAGVSITLELLSGPTLTSLTKSRRVDVRTTRSVARGILSALVAIHGAGYAHLDVKPDNLIFADTSLRKVKIIDFGYCLDMLSPRRERNAVRRGTPGYAAPEIALGAPYTARADVFSLGVVIAECLTGGYLFWRHQGAEDAMVRTVETASSSYKRQLLQERIATYDPGLACFVRLALRLEVERPTALCLLHYLCPRR